MDVEPVVRGAEHVEEGGSGLNVTGVRLGNRVIQSGKFTLVCVSVSVVCYYNNKIDIQALNYRIIVTQKAIKCSARMY